MLILSADPSVIKKLSHPEIWLKVKIDFKRHIYILSFWKYFGQGKEKISDVDGVQ